MSQTPKKKCFIITPIGNDTDPIRRHIDGIIDASIRPALEEKYEIVVAHKITDPGSITKQIISEIYQDELVIANLTNNNPNVMYELAFRHSLGKPVIMIAEEGTILPSDIIMQRTIFYRNDGQGVLDLREKLRLAENNLDFSRISSPIYDVLNEIDTVSQIITISQEPNSNEHVNDSALSYILKRLDAIDDKLLSFPSPQVTSGFPKHITFVFTYSSLPENFSYLSLKKRLDRVVSVDYHVSLRRLDFFTDSNIVEVEVILTSSVSLAPLFDFFISRFHSCGFDDIKLSYTV